MKTREELNALKTEYEQLNIKLSELTEEELGEVTGGLIPIVFAANECGSSIDSPVNTYRKDIGSDKNAKVIF